MFALFLVSIFHEKTVRYLQMQIEKVRRTHVHKTTQNQCLFETSRKPKQQKNRTCWRSFGLGPKLFFGVPREMSFFGFRFFKTKKLDVFLELILALSKAKNKKNVFFVFLFFAWIVFTFLLKTCPKTKRRPELFLPYFK